jgi:Lon protease-like protein
MTGRRLGMFPLSTVLFPHAEMPLHVFEPRYRALTADCLEGDARFGIVLIERGSEVGGGDQRSTMGTVAVITRAAALADGRWLLIVRGESLFRIDQWLGEEPYPLALVQTSEAVGDDPVDPALLHRATQCIRRTRGLLAEQGDAAALPAETVFDDDPVVATWQLCAEAPLSTYDAQRILAAPSTGQRLELLIAHAEALEGDLHRMMGSPPEDRGAPPS